MKTIGIIILLILLGGGVYFFVNSDKDDAPTTPAQQTAAVSTSTPPVVDEEPIGDAPFAALVTATNDGFEPKVTAIKQGETVRFVNNSDSKVWVASAFHPTHKEYPETSASDCAGSSFDTCRGLLPGEFWEFTFDKVGSWKFHNHLNPSQTGVIEVK